MENDSDYIDVIRRMVIVDLAAVSVLIRMILWSAPRGSAPWHTAQELAPNDYGRIDWAAVIEAARPPDDEMPAHDAAGCPRSAVTPDGAPAGPPAPDLSASLSRQELL